jgi:hypothetical protein
MHLVVFQVNYSAGTPSLVRLEWTLELVTNLEHQGIVLSEGLDGPN